MRKAKYEKLLVAKKDKLLSDCLELKRTGCLPAYHLRLSEAFEAISQLEGKPLADALIAYRQHPDTARDSALPAWALEFSDIYGLIACFLVASSGGFFLVAPDLVETQGFFPLIAIALTIFLAVRTYDDAQKGMQECLDFVVHWLRDERTLVFWKTKCALSNGKFLLSELLSNLQARPGLTIENYGTPYVYFHRVIDPVIEAIKTSIDERTENRDEIKEIKLFEAKVDRLVGRRQPQLAAQNAAHQQSWAEWLPSLFLGMDRAARPVDPEAPAQQRQPSVWERLNCCRRR